MSDFNPRSAGNDSSATSATTVCEEVAPEREELSQRMSLARQTQTWRRTQSRRPIPLKELDLANDLPEVLQEVISDVTRRFRSSSERMRRFHAELEKERLLNMELFDDTGNTVEKLGGAYRWLTRSGPSPSRLNPDVSLPPIQMWDKLVLPAFDAVEAALHQARALEQAHHGATPEPNSEYDRAVRSAYANALGELQVAITYAQGCAERLAEFGERHVGAVNDVKVFREAGLLAYQVISTLIGGGAVAGASKLAVAGGATLGAAGSTLVVGLEKKLLGGALGVDETTWKELALEVTKQGAATFFFVRFAPLFSRLLLPRVAKLITGRYAEAELAKLVGKGGFARVDRRLLGLLTPQFLANFLGTVGCLPFVTAISMSLDRLKGQSVSAEQLADVILQETFRGATLQLFLGFLLHSPNGGAAQGATSAAQVSSEPAPLLSSEPAPPLSSSEPASLLSSEAAPSLSSEPAPPSVPPATSSTQPASTKIPVVDLSEPTGSPPAHGGSSASGPSQPAGPSGQGPQKPTPTSPPFPYGASIGGAHPHSWMETAPILHVTSQKDLVAASPEFSRVIDWMRELGLPSSDSSVVTLVHPDNHPVEALFVGTGELAFPPQPAAPESPIVPNIPMEDYHRPVAVSNLDRALKLNYVPPTVAREINGKMGFLELIPQNQKMDYRLPLNRENAEKARAFDYIIGHGGRRSTSTAYRPDGSGEGLPIGDNNRQTLPAGPNPKWRWAYSLVKDQTGKLTNPAQEFIHDIDPEVVARTLADSGMDRETVRHALRRLARVKMDPRFLEVEAGFSAPEDMEGGPESILIADAGEFEYSEARAMSMMKEQELPEWTLANIDTIVDRAFSKAPQQSPAPPLFPARPPISAKVPVATPSLASTEAAAAPTDIRSLLETAPIVNSQSLSDLYIQKGANPEARIITLQFPDGRLVRAVFKPNLGDLLKIDVEEILDGIPADGLHLREAAASRLNDALNLDYVPTTSLREIDGKRGSVQLFAEDAQLAAAVDLRDHPFQREAIEKARVFDYVLGHTMRTGKGIMARPLGGESLPVGISNGASLRSGPSVDWSWPNQLVADQTGPLLKSTQEFIAQIDPEVVARTLQQSGIERKAVDHALRRLVRLKQTPQLLEIPEGMESDDFGEFPDDFDEYSTEGVANLSTQDLSKEELAKIRQLLDTVFGKAPPK